MSEIVLSTRLFGIGLDRYAAALWQFHAKRIACDCPTRFQWIWRDELTGNRNEVESQAAIINLYQSLLRENDCSLAVIFAIDRESIAQQAAWLSRIRWDLTSISCVNRPYFLGWCPEASSAVARNLLELGLDRVANKPAHVPIILSRIFAHTMRIKRQTIDSHLRR